MANSATLDTQSVQGTMLIPLWGRSKYSRENPDILDDTMAGKIVKESGFDFSPLEKTFGEFGGLCYIIRARKIDDAVRNFIARHPQATIVNIGSGLDTTFARVDNGQIRWYNLDLPDAIAFSTSLIPDSERETCFPKSFFDQSWFDDIAFDPKDGILFVSGGVFYYFRPDELQAVFDSMAHRFPGGEVLFDAESKGVDKLSNKMVAKSGNKGARMYFYVNSAAPLKQWSTNIAEATCLPFSKGISFKKSWSRSGRIGFRLYDTLGMMKFVHIRFK